MSENGDILLFQTEDGEVDVEVHLSGENVWLSLDQMAVLFQRDKSVIAKHIKNVFDIGELERNSTVAFFATVQTEGTRSVKRDIEYFNLDMVISIGYRVNSHRGVQFRIWATKALREYMVKGFVMDDERLSGRKNNYFDELLERVRKIRTSEANFYEKVRGIFATSIDYNPNEDVAQLFFKSAQNKFHYAITGKTAAEIVVSNVNAYKPDMGVVHKKGKRVTKEEAEIAKNYYPEPDLKRLELLVEQFLSFAELQSFEQRPMYMNDWARKLDDFIRLNDKKVLTNAGSVSRSEMKQVVNDEYEIYKRKLLEEGESYTKDDFERAIDLSAEQEPRQLPNGKRQ